jgi:hypothetical protein
VTAAIRIHLHQRPIGTPEQYPLPLIPLTLSLAPAYKASPEAVSTDGGIALVVEVTLRAMGRGGVMTVTTSRILQRRYWVKVIRVAARPVRATVPAGAREVVIVADVVNPLTLGDRPVRDLVGEA